MQSAVSALEPITDVIVFLAHMDRAEELEALNAVPGKIIVSISADMHVTTVEKVGGVILADSGAHGNVIGRLDLKIVNNKVVDFRHEFIPVDQSVALDETVRNIVTPYSQQINQILNEVIANSTIMLDRRGIEINLGNLVADAILKVSKADLAIQNAVGIRAEIDAGPITVGEVMTTLPFENFVVKLNLSGEEVIRMLEHGISNYPQFHGRHPVVAGMRFMFNPNKPVGSRIVDVYIGGKRIAKNENYTIATNCFLAGGGDGYGVFAGKQVEDTRILLRDAVIDYLRRIETVSERVDRRIQKTDRVPVTPAPVTPAPLPSDRTISPDAREHLFITRAEFAALLVRALGLEVLSDLANRFNDAAGFGWARGAIGAATEAGLISGYPDGSFGASRQISRAEIAVILSRVIRKGNIRVVAGQEIEYADAVHMPAWAIAGIRKVNAAGIIRGFQDRTFRPASNATRAEAAAMVYRLIANR